MIRNDSLAFLLPLLSNPRFDRRFFMNKYFVGAFIEDVDRYKYEYELILVYKYEPMIKYHEFEANLFKHSSFSKISYNYADDACIVYVFRMPIEIEEDFDFIMNGEYYRISPENKLKVSKFWNSDKGGRIYKMLFNPELNDEWSIPSYEKEVFDIMELPGKY